MCTYAQKKLFENPFYNPVLKLSLFLKIKTKFTIGNMFLGSLRKYLPHSMNLAPCLLSVLLEMCNKRVYVQENKALIYASKCCLIKQTYKCKDIFD